MAATFEDTVVVSWQHLDKIKKTTQILKDHFGINGYYFHRIDYCNNYTNITDVPDLTAHVMQTNAHLNSPYLRHPDSFQAGFILRDSFLDLQPDSILKIGHESYCYHNTLTLIEKSEEGIDITVFWGKPDNQQINDLALNHQPLIKKFVKHFKENHQSLLEQNNSLDLSKAMPDNYYACGKQTNHVKKMALLELLKEFGLSELGERSILLTDRERQCLRCVLLGKSAKHTAEILPISRRTVEAYLDSARHKLGCKNKSELFNCAEILTKFIALTSTCMPFAR
jgi:DNA-binding CsgD family transcriptional regulator